MKSHITRKQLTELTEKHLKYLQDWWKPVYGDWFTIKTVTDYKAPYGKKGAVEWYDDLFHEACVEDFGLDITGKKHIEQFYDFATMSRFMEDRYPLMDLRRMMEFLDEKRVKLQIVISDTGTMDLLCDSLWRQIKLWLKMNIR